MTTLDTIRAAIVAELNAVSGIGVVHDYERYAAREADFRSLYLYDLGAGVSQVRGWYVRRTGTRQTREVLGRYEDVHDWVVRGFMAIDDATASEKTFDNLVESVRDRFRANDTLGGVVANVYAPEGAGPKLEESQPVMFGGVLCHSARITLATSIYF